MRRKTQLEFSSVKILGESSENLSLAQEKQRSQLLGLSWAISRAGAIGLTPGKGQAGVMESLCGSWDPI